MKTRKSLADYHKKYPPRPGDTVEKFKRYEDFCKRDPAPDLHGDYHSWYARLKAHMEK